MRTSAGHIFRGRSLFRIAGCFARDRVQNPLRKEKTTVQLGYLNSPECVIIPSMQYNSITFLLFFSVFLILYLVQRTVRMRKLILLIGNLFFYTYAGDGSYLLIILLTSLIVYLTALFMGGIYGRFEKQSSELTKKERRAALITYKRLCFPILLIGLFFVLGFLFYTKIGGLLKWERVDSLADLRLSAVIVPLGLSYYTFSSVGYLLDVFWRKTTADRNYINVLLGISFFPTIVQGPIARYADLLPQFESLPGFDYRRVAFGVQRMIFGAMKKLVVADRLSIYSGAVFGSLPDYAGVEVFLAVLANAVSLYADFSGCMDIVIGAAECIGITLPENFRQPFFAKNAAEFWRRWHITLGAWFRDYVYMPIAMNPRFIKAGGFIRKKIGKRASAAFSTAVPLLVTWFLTGLWHGTGTDYIVWGLYWGILILIGSVFTPEFKKLTALLRIDPDSFGFRLFQMIRTFLLFGIGRMITAAGEFKGFFLAVHRLFAETRFWVLFNDSLYTHGLERKEFYVALFGIALIFLTDYLRERGYHLRESLGRQFLPLRWTLYIALILFVIVFGMYGSAFDAASFAYGAF